MRTWIVIALGAAVLTVTPAVAQNAKKDTKTSFSRLDRDGDGKLTLSEFLGKNKKNESQKTARFKKMDGNADGALTLDEMSAAPAKGKGKGKRNKNKAV